MYKCSISQLSLHTVGTKLEVPTLSLGNILHDWKVSHQYVIREKPYYKIL